mmetsp:Transcript_3560/g.9832  ORF Transcript_3560/g.9832 Transcript_3560/m.9832 type:complete len:1551 (-) Transcript_3560:86-4738(-)
MSLSDHVLELLELNNSADSLEDGNKTEPADLCERIAMDLSQAMEEVGLQNTSRESESENEEGGDDSFVRTKAKPGRPSLSSPSNVDPSLCNIRGILGNVSSTQISKLTETLTDYMSSRIDTVEDLMPNTQDTQVNEAVLTGQAPAITLTRTSICAAIVFARMAALPGALGAGLIQMQAIGALVALLKRWKTEVTAAAASFPKASKSSSSASTGNKRNGQSQKRMPQESERENKRSSKRSRGESNREKDRRDDESSLDEESLVGENDGPSSVESLNPNQLTLLGLRVAQEVAELPLHREFMSWSEEARESLIEATTLVMCTCSALQASKKKCQQDRIISDRALQTERSAADSLVNCILVEPNSSESPQSSSQDIETLTKRHETSVAIFRGLYQNIAMKENVPNGESGRLTAATSASKALCNFVKGVADDISLNRNRWPTSMKGAVTPESSTPGDTSSDSDDMQVAVTPKSSRKTARLSCGPSTPGRTSFGATPVRIKGGTKTPRRLSTSGKDPFSIAAKGRSSMPGRPQQRLVLSAVLGILQKLVSEKGAERTAVRANVVQTVQSCSQHLEALERAELLRFVIQLTYSKVSVHRLTAAEVLGHILIEPWLWPAKEAAGSPRPTVGWDLPDDDPSQRRNSLTPLVNRSARNMPAALFGALAGRITDKAPTVRTAALSALARLIREGINKLPDETIEGASVTDGLANVLAEESFSLACSLRVRGSLDEKSSVRKAAMDALVELLVAAESTGVSSVIRPLLAEEDIDIFVERCKDSSVVVRRAATEALTYLLEQRLVGNEAAALDGIGSLVSAWTSSVLPTVMDAEASVANKSVELVNRIVIMPLLTGASDGCASHISWSILSTLGGGPGRTRISRVEPDAMCKAVAGILERADSKTNLLKSMLNLICSAAKSSETVSEQKTAGVWGLCNALVNTASLLKDVTGVVKRSKIELAFLSTAWEDLLRRATQSSGTSALYLRSSMQLSMHVMARLAPCVDMQLAQQTRTRIAALLMSYEIQPEAISTAIAALKSLTVASQKNASAQEHKALCSEWIHDLFLACENRLSNGFDEASALDERVVVRALCTVGEISMVGFSPTEDGSSENNSSGGKDSSDVDVLIGLKVPPSKKLVNAVQFYMAEFLPGKNHRRCPRPARAHAFLAAGRFCLRDIRLAKEALNILARELHQNMSSDSDPTIQNNSLLILGDLCVKYTNLVDRYLPVMAACLQSGATDLSFNILSSPASNGFAPVRKSAVILLSGLIMQDYIKWRGLLFHRFLVATSDDDDEVSEIAAAVLVGPLALKQPKLFFNHFVESFFVLNCCKAHPMYVAAASAGDGGSGIAVGFDGINLKGESGRARRLRMYELMLSKMSDQEKLEATARLCKEILGGALVEGSELYRACTNATSNEHVVSVVSDALHILQSKSIRVGRSRARDGGGDDLDDPTRLNTGQRKAAAMGRLLSNVSRKHLVESVLPTLINLKAILQRACSPLNKDLMSFLTEMFRLYKSEVHEFLANDPTLLQEIEYDTKRHKQQQREASMVPTSIVADDGAPVLSP